MLCTSSATKSCADFFFFLYKEEILKFCTYRAPTEQLVAFMQKPISVMTSRVPPTALRKNVEKEVQQNALINRWEANKGPTKVGFLSHSRAEGLRVTKGTLKLLESLTECVGYKYLLISRLFLHLFIQHLNTHAVILFSVFVRPYKQIKLPFTYVASPPFYLLPRSERGDKKEGAK